MDRARILSLSTPDAAAARGARAWSLEILAEPKRRAAELLGEQPEVSEVESFGERLHATLARRRRAGGRGRAAARRRGPRRARGSWSASARRRPVPRRPLHRPHARATKRATPRRSPDEPPVLLHPGPGRGRAAPAPAAARPRPSPGSPSPRPSIARAPTRARLAAVRGPRDRGRGRACREPEPAACPSSTLSAGYTRLSDVPELTLVVPGPPPIAPDRLPQHPEHLPRPRRPHPARSTPGAASAAAIDAADHRQRRGRPRPRGRAQDLVLETTTAYWSLVTARESGPRPRRGARLLRGPPEGRPEPLRGRAWRRGARCSRSRSSATAPSSAGCRPRTTCAVANADLLRLVGLPAGTRVEPADAAAPAAAERRGRGGARAPALGSRPELVALRARVTRPLRHGAGGPRAAAGPRSASPPATTTRARTPASSPSSTNGRTPGASASTCRSAPSTAAVPSGGRAGPGPGRRPPPPGRRPRAAGAAGGEDAGSWTSPPPPRPSRSPIARLEAAQEKRAGRARPLPRGGEHLVGPARRRDRAAARGGSTARTRPPAQPGPGPPRSRGRPVTRGRLRHRGRAPGQALRRLHLGRRPQLRR